MAKKRNARFANPAKRPRARKEPVHIDFGPAIDLSSLLHHAPSHEAHPSHAQKQRPVLAPINASPVLKEHPIHAPKPRPALATEAAHAPLTYEELDRKIVSSASQAGHAALEWQAPLLALLLFGAGGALAGFSFGSKIDAFVLAACFGIAGALAARMALREGYVAWSGFIPGFLFGGGILLLLDLVFRQNLAAFWFLAGLAIGAALDFALRKKPRAG